MPKRDKEYRIIKITNKCKQANVECVKKSLSRWINMNKIITELRGKA